MAASLITARYGFTNGSITVQLTVMCEPECIREAGTLVLGTVAEASYVPFVDPLAEAINEDVASRMCPDHTRALLPVELVASVAEGAEKYAASLGFTS